MNDVAYQQCINPACGATFGVDEGLFECPSCGSLLDARYDWSRAEVPRSLKDFEAKWADRANPLSFSGVWRFRQLLPFAPPEQIVTIGEGQTILQKADAVAKYADMAAGHLFLQYEGLNPSGSFKDNGMTAAFSHARLVGARKAVCASTGNTSASVALFSALFPDIPAVVLIGSGKIAYGKLAQALDYGVQTLQVEGDFDACMKRVKEIARDLKIYLMNSLNPFRLEGQKTIMFRVLESLRWQMPDWIVVPGGNLGNSSAFGKAFGELKEIGLIDRVPRIAIINAVGADTLYRIVNEEKITWNGGNVDGDKVDAFYRQMDAEGRRAVTLASAIEINRPVNLPKALRALDITGGIVEKVTDQEIVDAKAKVGAGGIGCEPASAATVAGTKKLRAAGVIDKKDLVVCILTGHALKDPNLTVAYHSATVEELREKYGRYGLDAAPYANRPKVVKDDLDAIIRAIETGK
ncbi:MAG: threonine synthase [Phycisphaerae bacterium]|jgi:threonine synthase|nr:threonine synthase [Phycisphaerae bacterium]